MTKKIIVCISLFAAGCATLLWAQNASVIELAGQQYQFKEKKKENQATRMVYEAYLPKSGMRGTHVTVWKYQVKDSPAQVSQLIDQKYSGCSNKADPHSLCMVDYCGTNDAIVQTFQTASFVSSGTPGNEETSAMVLLPRITPKGIIFWGTFEIFNSRELFQRSMQEHPLDDYRAALCQATLL